MKSVDERIGQLNRQILEGQGEIDMLNRQVDQLVESQGSFSKLHEILSDISKKEIFLRGLRLQYKQVCRMKQSGSPRRLLKSKASIINLE